MSPNRPTTFATHIPPDRRHPTTSRGIQRRCGGGAAQPARTLQRNLSRLFVGPRHDSHRGRGRHCPPHRHQAGHAGRLDYRRAAVPSPAAWPRPCGVAVTSVPLSGTATLTGCHSLRFLSLAPARPIATLLGLALRIVPQAQQAVCWRPCRCPGTRRLAQHGRCHPRGVARFGLGGCREGFARVQRDAQNGPESIGSEGRPLQTCGGQ